MSKNLVIVESPAKAKTIKKYLGKDFEVLASYGHVRDLLPKKGAVDTENGFAMKYIPIEKNERRVDEIYKALKKSDALYLATDPDREGEAISWHLAELMKQKKALKDKPVHRVVFHEITQSAVTNAIKNAGEISMRLVDAQQARRALDYLVGFNLSPLLWKKIRRGLSAGRVQSPALRMIVEREIEIENFKSEEYWFVVAYCEAQKQEFTAKLVEFENQKMSQFSITNTEQAKKVEDTLNNIAKGELLVTNVEKKQRKRNPSPPFTTSTLQQEAARKLGFTTSRTMRLAQQLYEGIDIGSGSVGLITYMRTDSVNLAEEAIADIRDTIQKKYGKDYLPAKPHYYKTKSKNAQEAHEAIRPTSASRTPEIVKAHLSDEQFKLYNLIWQRTVASQMLHATIDTVTVDLSCGEGNRFRANGSTIAHPGFIMVYQEGKDDAKKEDGDENMLPPLAKGDRVKTSKIIGEQHFTEPPPRYSEASLVKALEEYGIGRPSTYASIIHTLLQREYAELDKKRFIPTDVGRIVNKFLTQHFMKYVDYDFTAHLEDQLDSIARGECEWIPVLEDFWKPFHEQVEHIDESVKRQDVTSEALNENCPKCGKPLSVRLGKRGRFIGCTGYPECDYTRNLNDSADAVEEKVQIIEGRVCPLCESPLQVKSGRYGKFIGCTNYPKCRHMEPLEKPKDMGVECPECHQAHFLQRKSRYGKIFYSCARYPDCKYAVWNEPIAEPCPQCKWPILTIKITKRHGKQKACPVKECGFVESMEEPEE
ncbi:MAG: type I DNA topoisomerase [Proteobacteria bacterium]|nr:type I DNA topoisomerase [Pseudomonadota bacterium]